MQEPPQQKAGAFGATPPRHRHRTVTVATFRFGKPSHFDIVRLDACAQTGGSSWLRRRATSGIAAVILGLADGRTTNSNAAVNNARGMTSGGGDPS